MARKLITVYFSIWALWFGVCITGIVINTPETSKAPTQWEIVND